MRPENMRDMIRKKRNLLIRAGQRWGCILVCVCLCLTGCQGIQRADDGTQSASDKLRVMTTIFPYYDFARQVAGELADVSMIVPAGIDTHSFEPTARDMIQLGKADVFIYNGGELESWVPRVMESIDNEHWITDRMMDHVDTFAEEHVEGMKEERGHTEEGKNVNRQDSAETEHAIQNTGNTWESDSDGADGTDHAGDEEEIDEHIWTSPANAVILVQRIAEDLGEADPAHRDEYLSNAERYIQELDRLDQEFQSVTEAAQEHYLVFGDRFPLRYFVEEYGLEYTAAFAGCSSDTEPSADTIAYLTDQMKSRNRPVVLKIELTSDRVANAIAEASEARVEVFHTCHNVTRRELDDGVTYLRLMEQNISVLKDALLEKEDKISK